MASNQSTTTSGDQSVTQGKGKGKATDMPPQDMSMGEDDSSSDEETGAEDEVYAFPPQMFSSPLTLPMPRRKKSVR